MRILVVGATGTIGAAAVSALEAGHEVIRASRSSEIQVDLTDTESIQQMFSAVGTVDAVISCTGKVPYKPLTELEDADYQAGFSNKVLGQVNLVTVGIDHVADRGSFTLTTGILSRAPIATGTAASLANGALESFVMAAATELPRGIRINAVSPTVLVESPQYHPFFPGFPQVPAADVGRSFVRSVQGVETGQVFKI